MSRDRGGLRRASVARALDVPRGAVRELCGVPGVAERIVVDTCHFKGNYPDSCSIECCNSANDTDVLNDIVEWFNLLPQTKLSADNEHEYSKEINTPNTITHVRLNIFPDGGISRLRIFGKITK